MVGNLLKVNRINQASLKIEPALPAGSSSSIAIAPMQLDVTSLPFPVAILRANDGYVMYANLMMNALLQCEKSELIGKPISGLYDGGQQRSEIFKLLKQRAVIPAETVTLKTSRNNAVKVSATVRLTHFENSLCVLVALQDVPQDVCNLKKLYSATRRYSMALQVAKIGIWSWDLMGDHIDWDNSMHDLFGIGHGTFSGKQKEFIDYMVPEDRAQQLTIGKRYFQEGGKFDTKFRIVRPDGETRVIISRGEATKDKQGIVSNVVGVCWDVTENFALSAKVEYQALHDPLTGLLNRYEMQRKLKQLLKSVKQEPSENVFCYFDLDRFKVVNDACGHEAGDALLSRIAEHLKPYIKKSDPFARMGGDEFAVIIGDSTSDDAKKVAEALRYAVEEFHFEWGGKIFDVNLSIALIPITDDKTVSDILGAADITLSAAKDSGGNRTHQYRPQDSTMIRRHDELQWVVELEDALREDRFQLNFQTIQPISSDIKQGLRYEVLLRVINTSGQIIAPGELLNAAEQFDMATRVDGWVINAMFDWLKNNQDHCKELSLCSINLSGASIGDPDFLAFLQEKLSDKDIPKDKLSFEVTENAAIKNIKKAAKFIKSIKEFGCAFALDDFGSGLSSFAYLKDLPVDFLKIDGVFVKGINKEPVDYAMVKAIHDVGKIMGMETIAEYVENEEILTKLKEIGVDYGQGYYFGKPEKLDDVIVVGHDVAEPT